MLELQVRQPSLSVLSMQSAELRGPSSYPAFSLADPPHTHPDAYLRVRALPTLRSACAGRGRVRSVPRGGRCGHMAHRRPPFANTLRSGACINGLDVWAPFRDCCTVVVPAYRNSPAVVGAGCDRRTSSGSLPHFTCRCCWTGLRATFDFAGA